MIRIIRNNELTENPMILIDFDRLPSMNTGRETETASMNGIRAFIFDAILFSISILRTKANKRNIGVNAMSNKNCPPSGSLSNEV